MFFSDQIIVDYLFCCHPPPSLQVTTVWCSHFSRTVSPSCPYGDLHPPVWSIPNFGGGDNSSADLVSFATFFQQGGFILRPSFSQDCNCWEYCRHLFWWSLLPSVHSRPYGLCFAYRTVLLRNFIHPVWVSFVHNTTVLWNSSPYDTSSKP